MCVHGDEGRATYGLFILNVMRLEVDCEMEVWTRDDQFINAMRWSLSCWSANSRREIAAGNPVLSLPIRQVQRLRYI